MILEREFTFLKHSHNKIEKNLSGDHLFIFLAVKNACFGNRLSESLLMIASVWMVVCVTWAYLFSYFQIRKRIVAIE